MHVYPHLTSGRVCRQNEESDSDSAYDIDGEYHISMPPLFHLLHRSPLSLSLARLPAALSVAASLCRWPAG